MPFSFEHIEGVFRPAVTCEFCEQTITEDDGVAIYEYHEEAEDFTSPVIFSHKREACKDAALKKAGWAPNAGPEELDVMLVKTLVGLGVGPKQFEELYTRQVQKGMIPLSPHS